MTQLDRLTNIIVAFGGENQLLKSVEELGELSDAIVQGNENHIFEELCDVELMLDQLKIMYKFDAKKIDDYKEFKLNRTEQRIKSGYYKTEKF